MLEISKTCILRNGNHSFNYVLDKRINTISGLYYGSNFILRNIRKLWFKYKLPFSSIWFNRKMKYLHSCNTVIIFDTLIEVDFLYWFQKHNRDKRLVFWYHNPVNKSLKRSNIPSVYEVYTYSTKDSERYQLKNNTQFYLKDFKLSNFDIIYDVLFIGRDKKRLDMLLQLKKDLDNKNLRTNFHITADKRSLKSTKYNYKNPIPYEDVLNEISKSIAILDILSEPSDGLTLRVMESLFHRKKLITNSTTIKEYDFYHPDNIFVLGEDDFENINVFLSTPYKIISASVVERYEFANWAKRF